MSPVAGDYDASTLRPASLAQSFWQESGCAGVGSCIDFSMHAGKLWFPVLSAMTLVLFVGYIRYICITLVRFVIGPIGGGAKYSWDFHRNLSAKGVACVT